jgi:hypothetical protein
MSVSPAAAMFAVLGPALLALGVAGLVPPMHGLDAPPMLFRYITVPWLLPGAVATYRAAAAFRSAWRTAEHSGPSPKVIRRTFLERLGKLYGIHVPRSRVLREWMIGLSGLLQSVAAGVAFLIGLIGSWLGLSGQEGLGELLTSAAVVVASAWICITGVRRFGRRAVPEWCMEAKRVAVSVRLRRLLETLAVWSVVIIWLLVGQIVLVFNLAG